MIHPTKPREAPPPRRAVLRMGSGPHDGSALVTPHSEKWLPDRAALLAEVTSPQRPYGQVWLTPQSPGDWGWLIPPLVRAGWHLGASSKAGRCHSLFVYEPGARVVTDSDTTSDESDDNADKAPEPGALFAGRSAAGFLDPRRGLSPIDEARDTSARLALIDEAVRAEWPGVGLASTPALTGSACFASMLQDEIGCDPQVEVTLRRAGAYGGGRIQLFVPPETVVARAAIRDVPPSDHAGYEEVCPHADEPYDVDLMSAYPTALMVPGATGAEYVGEDVAMGGEGDWRAPCTISYAMVEIPKIAHGPLRVLDEEDRPTYPTGARVTGAWTSDELRAAEACGARVLVVQSVWRFEPRAEFVRFGETMKRWRRALPEGHPARLLAKAMAVGTVGGWGMRPARTRRWIGPASALKEADLEGARVRGPYDWDLVVPMKQRPRALLPAACFVTGRVRAWSALALHGLAITGAEPLYWHTDGGATRRHPGAGLQWAAAHGAPPVGAWRMRPLRRIQLWAPGTRHEVAMDGTEKRTG